MEAAATRTASPKRRCRAAEFDQAPQFDGSGDARNRQPSVAKANQRSWRRAHVEAWLHLRLAFDGGAREEETVPYDLEWTCKPAFRYVRVEMCIRRLAFRSMLLRLSRRTKDCRGVRVYQTLSVLHCSSGLICAVPAQEAKTNRHQTLRVLPWSALLFCAHRRCLYPEVPGVAGSEDVSFKLET
jgi:hypothetical protein